MGKEEFKSLIEALNKSVPEPFEDRADRTQPIAVKNSQHAEAFTVQHPQQHQGHNAHEEQDEC